MLLLTRLVDKRLEVTKYARKRIFFFGWQISTEGACFTVTLCLHHTFTLMLCSLLSKVAYPLYIAKTKWYSANEYMFLKIFSLRYVYT